MYILVCPSRFATKYASRCLFFTNSVVFKGAAAWYENIAIQSSLTFKSQHCCCKIAWMIQEYLAWFNMNGYFWIGFQDLPRSPVTHWEPTWRLGCHLASRSMTVIFILAHIIHVGVLWSAAELSVGKAVQERGLEESDNAAQRRLRWREKTRAGKGDEETTLY